jgi:EAL domain-containing protein (putative c-di-GMP-specific phosphodiesterase class I)
MTKLLGANVQIEGIEQDTQIDFLRDNHGVHLQGYYSSESLSVKECEKLLENIKS